MKSPADVRQPAPAAAEGEPKSPPKRIPSPLVKRGVRAEVAQPPASPARSILAVAQNTFRRSDGAARKGDIRMASGAVITKDQLRKLVARPPQQHKWVLMPDSPLHQAWDALLLCVIVYTCVMTPVRIAFDPDGRSVGPYGLFWFEIVLDFCFLIDLLVTLNTAVEISDRWVTDRPRIARRYMQGWLAVDVLAAIPVDFILYMSIDQNRPLAALMASVTALRLLRLVRLIKITRMVKAHSIFKKIEEVSTMNQGLIHVVQMILSIAFLAHVVACGWFATGTLLQPDQPAGWLSGWYPNAETEPAEHLPRARQYLYSIYWSLSTLLTVGYGDVTPTSDEEIVFACFAMLFGATAFAAMTGTMASMLQSYSYPSMLRRQRLQQLNAFLGKSKVPAELSRRVKTYMQRHLDHNTLNEDAILDGLPPRLRAELRLSGLVGHASRIPLFRALGGKSSLEKLCAFLEVRTFVPDETVVRLREPMLDAFFLTYGSVRVLLDDAWPAHGANVVNVLTPPDVFGEPFSHRERAYTFAMQAVRWADCLTLSTAAYLRLFLEHPDWTRAIKVATELRGAELEAQAAAAHKRRRQEEGSGSEDEGEEGGGGPPGRVRRRKSNPRSVAKAALMRVVRTKVLVERERSERGRRAARDSSCSSPASPMRRALAYAADGASAARRGLSPARDETHERTRQGWRQESARKQGGLGRVAPAEAQGADKAEEGGAAKGAEPASATNRRSSEEEEGESDEDDESDVFSNSSAAAATASASEAHRRVSSRRFIERMRKRLRAARPEFQVEFKDLPVPEQLRLLHEQVGSLRAAFADSMSALRRDLGVQHGPIAIDLFSRSGGSGGRRSAEPTGSNDSSRRSISPLMPPPEPPAPPAAAAATMRTHRRSNLAAPSGTGSTHPRARSMPQRAVSESRLAAGCGRSIPLDDLLQRPLSRSPHPGEAAAAGSGGDGCSSSVVQRSATEPRGLRSSVGVAGSLASGSALGGAIAEHSRTQGAGGEEEGDGDGGDMQLGRTARAGSLQRPQPLPELAMPPEDSVNAPTSGSNEQGSMAGSNAGADVATAAARRPSSETAGDLS